MRKRLFALFLSASAIVFSVAAVGCGSQKTEHYFGEWIIEKPATCTSYGHRYRVCTDCNYMEWNAIDIVPHEFKIVKQITELYHDVKCAYCLEELTKVAHIYDNNNICTVCDYEKESTLGLSFSPYNNALGATEGYAVSGTEAEFAGKKIIIPSRILDMPVTAINAYAFSSCLAVTSITLPVGIIKISRFAFSSCSTLTDIIYKGTKQQWNAVAKEYGWDYGTGDYVIHCTDGNINKS